MWEIYVPTTSNTGKPIRTRQHKEWDRRVMHITGGMTIASPSIGKWDSPTGVKYSERMIPVKIACTRSQIMEIVKMTITFYEQEAIFCAKVSDEVITMYADGRVE